MFKQFFQRLAIKSEHYVVVFGFAAGGAALGYVQAHLGDLPAAMADKGLAEHMALGALYAAVVAVVGLARKSFLLPAPPPAQGGAS